MSFDALYETYRTEVLTAITSTDDRTTIVQARHRAHDSTFAPLSATAKAVRELDEVTLESVLLLLGERP